MVSVHKRLTQDRTHEIETAERSFSCLLRLKTYLRSTMAQERLNHLLILSIRQDETDLIDLRSIARDFVSLNETRRDIFGHI